MSDYDSDFENDYDGIESDVTENHESTGSEVDQVAALLLDESGDEESASQVRDKAKTKIYDSDGTAKNNTKTWTSTPIDRHGNREFGGDDSSLREAQKAPEYGLSGFDITNTINNAQQQWDQAVQNNQRLEQMYHNGEINAQEYDYYARQQGMAAGIARSQALEAQIHSYEYEKQRERAYGELQKNLGDDFSPAKRDDTLRAVAKWMSGQGLSNDYLRQVDDPAVLATAYNAMKAIENDKAQRLENAALKQKVRELNKALGRGQKKAAKSRNMGNRHGGPVGEAQLEEITDLIFGGGK